MIPFFIVRYLLPIYSLGFLILGFLLFSEILNGRVTGKRAFKALLLNHLWIFLIITEKGRKKLFSYKEDK